MATIKMKEKTYCDGVMYTKDGVYDVSKETAFALGTSCEIIDMGEKKTPSNKALNNPPKNKMIGSSDNKVNTKSKKTKK